jgi:molybdopterin converting factor subunit 1
VTLSMNRIKVLFFATLRDRAGTKSVEIEISDGSTVRELKENITLQFPSLGPSLKTVITSVNHEYASEDAVLPADAEVGMFPPVSGG